MSKLVITFIASMIAAGAALATGTAEQANSAGAVVAPEMAVKAAPAAPAAKKKAHAVAHKAKKKPRKAHKAKRKIRKPTATGR